MQANNHHRCGPPDHRNKIEDSHHLHFVQLYFSNKIDKKCLFCTWHYKQKANKAVRRRHNHFFCRYLFIPVSKTSKITSQLVLNSPGHSESHLEHLGYLELTWTTGQLLLFQLSWDRQPVSTHWRCRYFFSEQWHCFMFDYFKMAISISSLDQMGCFDLETEFVSLSFMLSYNVNPKCFDTNVRKW